MHVVHPVLQQPINQSPPAGYQLAYFGMGCFWGAERRFWQHPGIWVTAVGYCGGLTEDPCYRSVCTGNTQHAEVVRVIFDPKLVAYWDLLKLFWESHDPTQGMRQGNDLGSQYRSVIYCTTSEQLEQAKLSRRRFQRQLEAQQYPIITTEIELAPKFYYAEPEHQQYLAKNPQGYCGLRGTGCSLD